MLTFKSKYKVINITEYSLFLNKNILFSKLKSQISKFTYMSKVTFNLMVDIKFRSHRFGQKRVEYSLPVKLSESEA